MLLFLGDFSLSTMRTRMPLGEWLPVTNLFALLGGTFTALLPEGVALSPGVAATCLLTFGVVTLLAGAVLFDQRDIHQ